MNNRLPSVAIALFVNNEYSDIAGWIAWHLALGVKTLFIYDDHSTDGTWEIIQSAARCYDIRAVRTDLSSQPDFTLRQRDAFFGAAKECQGKYDWIGFLDGDEYVYLRHGDSLPGFFAKFAHADAIAFSWKIYGSSNRVVRPRVPAPEAFTRHSTSELNDNVLIKSFVRPEKLGSTWHNPHWFDMPEGRYVRPDGSFVREPRPEQAIAWGDAYIMHFICRSMAQYVQRIQRRLNSDLADSQGYWDHFNRNDIEDLEPLRIMPTVRRYLSPLNHEILLSAINYLRTSFRNSVSERGRHQIWRTEKPRLYSIITHWGTELYFSEKAGCLVHAEAGNREDEGLIPIFATQYPSTPQLITLNIKNGDYHRVTYSRPLYVVKDERISISQVYNVQYIDKGGMIYLRNPLSSLYLGAPPLGEKTEMPVPCDRRKADSWEQLCLIDLNDNPRTLNDGYTLPSNLGVATFDDVIDWIVTLPRAPTPDEFLRVMYSIEPTVRANIVQHVRGLLHAFI